MSASSESTGTSQVSSTSSSFSMVEFGKRYALILAWIVEVVVFSALLPETFLTFGNWRVILAGQAALLIMTLGLLMPLIAGEYDFAMPSVYTVTVVLIGYTNVVMKLPIGVSILAAIAFALVVAAMHITLIVKLRISSIVVTLGSATLLSGIAFAIQSRSIAGISEILVAVARTKVVGIQAYFWWGLLLTAILWYVFQYTPFGRYLFFTGASREVARLSGVAVDRIRAISLLCSALVASFAGMLSAGLLGTSDPRVGSAFLLPMFASAFLGSTVISPGRFNAWGTFVAVYFLITGITGLQLLGFSGWIENVFYGAALIIAVTIARLVGARQVGE